MPQPEDVMEEVHGDSQTRTGRVAAYLAFIAAAHLAGHVMFGPTGIVPSEHVAPALLTATVTFAGSSVVPDATEAAWDFYMLRHGVARSGGQRPGMP